MTIRFQYSLRTLFIVTAIVALLLVPVAWVARERQQVLVAREAALRAVVLAERDRARAVQARYDAALRAQATVALSPGTESSATIGIDPSNETAAKAANASAARPTAVEKLMRENAALKKTVEELRREIERLKAGKG